MKRLITHANFIIVILFISWELNAQMALPTFQPFQYVQSPNNYVTLTGTPNNNTVFNSIDITFFYDNMLMHGFWNGPSDRIIVGHYNKNGYWSHASNSSGYSQFPDNASGSGVSYDRMVLIPATGRVIHTDQAQYPSDYNKIYIGSINEDTGLLGSFSTVVFSDGYTGDCNLLSSSATEFLCYTGSVIRVYTTSSTSTTLTYVKTVTLSQQPSETCGSYCFGGTFAWDGMYYYFSNDGNSNSNKNYVVYDSDGSKVATRTASGNASITGTYFDWSVGRYVIHDGFGYRSGGTKYSWGSTTSDDDSQCYSPVSSVHTF
jgi:hypothetical protein